jgi:hypothetical protein
MARDGAITFSDLTGKLEVLSVACEKCGRLGHRAHPFLIRGVCQLSGNPHIKWELIIFLCGGFDLRLFFRGESLAIAEGDWQIQAHFPGAEICYITGPNG